MKSYHNLHKLAPVRHIRAALTNRYLHAGLILVALAAAIAILVLNNVLMPRYTHSGSAFSMPAVEGLTQEVAAETLHAYQLGTTRWDFVPDFSVTRGTVLSQSPPPGAQVKPGRTVYLKLSDNTRDSVQVPNLVSSTISAATNALRRAQLLVGSILPDSVPSPYPDVVVRQSPPAGSMVLLLDSVSFWYSTGLGSRLVEVPLMSGLPVQEAVRRLREAGLHARIYPQLDDTASDPPVVSQSHPAGTRVPEGSELTLFWNEDP